MYLTQRLDERSMFAPGAGKVVSTEYESISVQLVKQLTSEGGRVTITAPSGIVAGQTFLINISFDRILANSLHQMCACDYAEVIRIVMPSPLPSNPANWIAATLRTQPAFASAMTSTVANNVITYSLIRPGVIMNISSPTASLVAKTVTTVASNGMIPNIGDGSAIFYTPADNNMRAETKNLFGRVGYPDDSVVPMFMGIRRAYDKIQNLCDPMLMASWVKEDCCEVVRRGTVHIPLEVVAPALPVVGAIGIVARFTANGANTNSGSYRIVDTSVENFAPPAGTILIPQSRIELVTVAPDRRTALVKLR